MQPSHVCQAVWRDSRWRYDEVWQLGQEAELRDPEAGLIVLPAERLVGAG
jgi:hypothetical protein